MTKHDINHDSHLECEEVRTLWEIIVELPQEYRLPGILRCVDNLSIEDIAQELGTSVSHVEALLREISATLSRIAELVEHIRVPELLAPYLHELVRRPTMALEAGKEESPP